MLSSLCTKQCLFGMLVRLARVSAIPLLWFIGELAVKGTNTTVVPSVFQSVEAGEGSSTLRTAQRIQQVYSYALFGPKRILIHELRFRPSAVFGAAFSTTVSNMSVNLSTTAVQPDAMNTTCISNVGPDDTLVFSGPLTISSAFTGPPGGPKDFDIVIPFSTPFAYDPYLGNLLVDVRNFANSTASLVDAGNATFDRSSRLISGFNYDWRFGSPSASSDVIQVQFSISSNNLEIVQPPQDVEALVNGSAYFQVRAVGAPLVRYQWFHNGNALAGATSRGLYMTNVQPAQAGTYSVLVSNSAGGLTSPPATLAVRGLAGATSPAEARNADGGFGSFTLRNRMRLQQVFGASSFPNHPIWIHELRFRPSAVVGHPSSGPGPNLEIHLSTSETPPGGLSVNFASNTGRDEALVFNGVLDLNSAFHGPAQGPKQFDIVVPLSSPFPYHPGFGNLLVELRNHTGSAATFVDLAAAPDDQASRVFTSNPAGGAGTPDSGADIIEFGYALADGLPQFLEEPQDITTFLGQTVALRPKVYGSGPLSYQWYLGGTPFPSGTNFSLVLTNVQPMHGGAWQLIATNASGSATSRVCMVAVRNQRGLVLPPFFARTNAGADSVTFYFRSRLLQVFGAELFPPQVMEIQEVRFRPNALTGVPASVVVPNIQVNASTTLSQPDALNGTFASNHGADEKVVFSGSLSLSTEFRGPPGGPKEFDIVLPFTTPFHYDPSRGNLLLDFRNFSGSPPFTVDLGGIAGDRASRAYANDPLITEGGGDSAVDIIQVVYAAAPSPPLIYEQPQDVDALAGGSVHFETRVGSVLPACFQWYFDGLAIPGATNSDLVFSNAQLPQAGSYWLVASNDAGAVTSRVATLTVRHYQGLVLPPLFAAFDPGQNSAALRAPMRTQVAYGSSLFPSQPILVREIRFRPSAAGGARFAGMLSNLQVNLSTTPMPAEGLSSVFGNNIGTDEAMVFNGPLPLRTGFFGPASGPKEFDLIVPLQSPFPFNPTAGNLLVDIRNWSGSAAPNVNAGAVPGDGGGRTLSATVQSLTGMPDTSSEIVQLAYTAISGATQVLQQPEDTAVLIDGTGLFKAQTAGAVPMFHQWYFNGQALAGATQAHLRIVNAQPADDGAYWLIVTNQDGAATSRVARLTVQNLQGFVVPPAFAGAEGGVGGTTLKNRERRQQAYGSALFPASPMVIRELRFRPSLMAGRPFSAVLSNLQVNLSTTAAQPELLSGDFTSNLGEDNTLVFSGMIEIQSGFRGLGGDPREFDIVIPLTQPFGYHPGRGNLLVDIRNLSASMSEAVDASAVSGDSAGSVFAGNLDSESGSSSPQADVIQVVYSIVDEAPQFVRQPSDHTALKNSSVFLEPRVAGAPPMTFKWFFEEQALPNATNLNLALENLQLEQAGAYRLVVSNHAGATTSGVARISFTNLSAVVAPSASWRTEGTFGSTVMRDIIRWQDIFGAGHFTSGPILLRELRLRPRTRSGWPFSATFTNLQVNLSSTPILPDALNRNPANNRTTNSTVVFSGPLTISSGFRGPVAGPKLFDIVIPFNLPFLYDPAEGSLLVDIRNFGGSSGPMLDASNAADDQASRAWHFNLSMNRDTGADIMQFGYTALEAPPKFLGHPQDSTVIAGDTARMNAIVSGTPPLSYQWYFEGSLISDATNSSLALSNVQSGQTGGYWVQAGSPFGSATSQVASLVVTNLGKWIVPPQFATVDAGGAAITLRSIMRLQQVYAAETLPGEPVLIRALRFRPSSVLGFPFNTTIANFQVRLSTTMAQPNALSATFTDNVGPDEALVHYGPLAVMSRFHGPAAGPKETDITVPFAVPFFYAPASGNLLVDIFNLTGSGASSIDGRNVASNHASRAFAMGTNATTATGRDNVADVIEIVYSRLGELSGLTIHQGPQSRTAEVGENVRLQVFAEGVWPLSYLWYREDVPLPGQTNALLTLTNVQFPNAGSYSVAVTNAAGGLISAPAVLTVAYPPPAIIVRGPYLQSATTNSIVVCWRTDRPVDGRVSIGPATNDLTPGAINAIPATEHAMTLTNLQPATRYFYAVGTASTDLLDGSHHWFRTAPMTSKPTRIWAIGDCGTASLGRNEPMRVRDAYLAHAGATPTDLWLMLGDNAYPSGTDAEYQSAVFAVYQELLRTTPLWPTIGNHETYAATPAGHIAYYDIFSLPQDGRAGGVASGTERYYSFDHGNIHFVCLDSEISDRQPDGPMLTWLEADLAANTKDWLIAFWHSPPYSRGSHNSDYEGNLFQMREWVVPVLESYGVDLVLCGHSHSYERSFLIDGHYGASDSLLPTLVKDSGSGRIEDTGAYRKPTVGPGAGQGAVYVVAGSAGQVSGGLLNHPAMFISLNRLGSVVLDIDGDRLDMRFLRETAEVDDYFTILKGVPAEPLRLATIRVAGGIVTVNWKSVAGETYRVERTDNLNEPQWVSASGNIIATGATSMWSGPAASITGKAYYRVAKVSE